MMPAAEIHARIGPGWPDILKRLGISGSALCNEHGPCPACGGKDRFRFDNRRGRGDYICNQCGAGDGFRLLQLVHGWTFSEARQQVIGAAGLACGESSQPPARVATATRPSDARKVEPPERVLRLWRGSFPVADCDDAVAYLTSRGLWPLPQGCTLRAHPAVEYFDEGLRVGRFSALLAGIFDTAGTLVSAHVTYLQAGRKLATHKPRKILSPLSGRTGCAARLMPSDGTLGIAEGVETALSATAMDGVPVWAALNAALLARFDPPPGVACLRVYADHDEAGLAAARQLVDRLQGRVQTEVRIPSSPAKDWNDVLAAQRTDAREARQ